MSSILMVYGSSHGQTGKIVERLAKRLTADGYSVTIWKGDALPPRTTLAMFERFVVAGSVIYGKHQRYLVEFVRANIERLNSSPTVFLSVCGAIAGKWEPGAAQARKYVDRFLASTGLRPLITRSMAGAVNYTQYGFFTRFLMKMISRQTGRPTDTSRDWDLTDWDAVDRFAKELSQAFAPQGAVRPAVARTGSLVR